MIGIDTSLVNNVFYGKKRTASGFVIESRVFLEDFPLVGLMAYQKSDSTVASVGFITADLKCVKSYETGSAPAS